MRHRIFVDTITPPEVTVRGDEFHHSVRVVRVRAGEEVELFDRAGNACRGIVEHLDREHAVITTGDALPSRESALNARLAMAIIQLEKFELVLQKATELGVRSFVPLVTERVELRPERYANKRERWERIIFEAVKQSGRTAVPRIEEPRAFADVLRDAETKILFDADAEPAAIERLDSVTLMIGPEGGWSDDELRDARVAGCLFQRLGPRRLRAETAAIAGIAVITSRFGDL
ncbi:MAG TPA: RsmE family RNA methyltransferase [Thermoanaerobaculia bacterium]|nr:RsmE family RNA methyltransferase [Thermoanaerobaculia bacterium]